jgi:hypothetical protein
MAKTDQQRITDTLNFLQNTNIVPAGPVRANAHQLAQDYMGAVYPNVNSPAYSQFSQTLSLGFHLFSDPNQLRHMVRALFLLWKAMNHSDNRFTIPLQNVGQISQGTVQRVLTNYIYKACCTYERAHGGNNGATAVLAVFQANSMQFLGDNKVSVSGSGHRAGGQGRRNVLPCKFEYNPDRDRYEFAVRMPAVAPGSVGIQVESVTAFHWTDPRYVPALAFGQVRNLNTTNFNQMTAIKLSGVHPMVTTQFTGCAYCMAEHGGNMYCAHVSPYVVGMAPNTQGNPLALRIMATNGAFANAGNTQVRVYGRNVGSAPNPAGYNIGNGGGAATYMTIVGFPGGTSYNLYSQTTVNDRISAVTQIY